MISFKTSANSNKISKSQKHFLKTLAHSNTYHHISLKPFHIATRSGHFPYHTLCDKEFEGKGAVVGREEKLFNQPICQPIC